MGRVPAPHRLSEGGLNKGPWTEEEDAILSAFIKANGEGNWRTLPKLAGLQRCRKSCRLRWMNYLRPDLKRGNFSPDEDELIVKLHSLLGNRWSLIAGRIPGRTDNEIKNYWNSRLRRKLNPTTRVEATPLSCSSFDSVNEVTLEPSSKSHSPPLAHTAKSSIVANPGESSLFPDYASSLDFPMFPEYARFHTNPFSEATPSEPCSSDETTACPEECSDHQSLEAGYYSTWTSSSLDEVAKETVADSSVKHVDSYACSPESVLNFLPPQGLDIRHDFSSGNDFASFTNGLADLGETDFQKLLHSMPLSPLHTNLDCTFKRGPHDISQVLLDRGVAAIMLTSHLFAELCLQ